MIAKLIAYGVDRDEALARIRSALTEMVVDGIDTNIRLHQRIMADAGFTRGGVNIHYLEQKIARSR